MPNSPIFRFLICPLCNELVEIDTAKTDHDGKAIHEECYVRSLKSKVEKPIPPAEKPRRVQRPA